jgi:uncharacterized protein YecE (DUF72 family)
VGTSGWHYEHWRDRFYPPGLPKKEWLKYYTGHFNTVELNNSFYRLPTEKAFDSWYDSSPDGFIFTVKVSRYITHIKRLKGTEEAVEKFITRAGRLKEKLGPLLYQLPPNIHRNDAVLQGFLSTLPRGFSHVIEFRHSSWFDDSVLAILRKFNVAFCVFDMPSLNCPVAVTADIAYIRFHGSSGLYSSLYTDEELSRWSQNIENLASGVRSVYIYFNNDAEAYAIQNATILRRYLET